MAEPVLIITGPTASGKTALAVTVAERLGGEIVSADSRQVYRGMDVGTAKATAEERARVPHHGLDLVDPDTRYSAGRFGRDARRWIAGIRGRGKVPIVVGGTGFFIRALTEPLFQEPPLDAGRRRGLHAFLDRIPDPELDRWLHHLDPETAVRLRSPGGGGGRQRVLRALEVPLLTGRRLSWWHRHHPSQEPPVPGVFIVLDLPRTLLYQRIDARVDAMFDGGLAEEARRLQDMGYGPADPGMTATGYPETMALLRGEFDLEEARDRIRRATRRYARRQLTWFRNQLPDDAAWLDGTRPLDELVDEVTTRWRDAA